MSVSSGAQLSRTKVRRSMGRRKSMVYPVKNKFTQYTRVYNHYTVHVRGGSIYSNDTLGPSIFVLKS